MRIPGADARHIGAQLCSSSVAYAVAHWPPAALDAGALRDAHDAICALLEADARGELLRAMPAGLQCALDGEDTEFPLLTLSGELCGERPMITRTSDQRVQLLTALGLTVAERASLEALFARARSAAGVGDPDAEEALRVQGKEWSAARAAQAAASLARHGLQRCTLPACGAQEPAPRTYKKCSRCGKVYYCCVEHQHADWRRHKREDGCKKAQA